MFLESLAGIDFADNRQMVLTYMHGGTPNLSLFAVLAGTFADQLIMVDVLPSTIELTLRMYDESDNLVGNTAYKLCEVYSDGVNKHENVSYTALRVLAALIDLSQSSGLFNTTLPEGYLLEIKYKL